MFFPKVLVGSILQNILFWQEVVSVVDAQASHSSCIWWFFIDFIYDWFELVVCKFRKVKLCSYQTKQFKNPWIPEDFTINPLSQTIFINANVIYYHLSKTSPNFINQWETFKHSTKGPACEYFPYENGYANRRTLVLNLHNHASFLLLLLLSLGP